MSYLKSELYSSKLHKFPISLIHTPPTITVMLRSHIGALRDHILALKNFITQVLHVHILGKGLQ